MKSINIKIPLEIAARMDDDGTLNPNFLSTFIEEHMYDETDSEPVKGLAFNYTFKIDKDLHKEIKMIALNNDLPMNEFVARLIVRYYRRL